MQRDDALHGVVVLVGRRRERRQGSQRRRDEDRVSFGGSIIFSISLVDERNLRLRVLDGELRVTHEVMDGAAGLRRLQTFIRRHAVSESVHHTDLTGEKETGETHM